MYYFYIFNDFFSCLKQEYIGSYRRKQYPRTVDIFIIFLYRIKLFERIPFRVFKPPTDSLTTVPAGYCGFFVRVAPNNRIVAPLSSYNHAVGNSIYQQLHQGTPKTYSIIHYYAYDVLASSYGNTIFSERIKTFFFWFSET